MKYYNIYVLCLLCAILVFVLLGLNFFAAYQLLPILIFIIFRRKVFQTIKGQYVRLCYALSVLAFLLFPLVMQIGWYFDINEMSSGSSTSGLLFLYLPIYSIFLGLIPALLAIFIKRKQT